MGEPTGGRFCPPKGNLQIGKFSMGHRKQIISFGLLLVFLLVFAHDETIMEGLFGEY
jgi:hypothetical protein